jgi:hypothetical protein
MSKVSSQKQLERKPVALSDSPLGNQAKGPQSAGIDQLQGMVRPLEREQVALSETPLGMDTSGPDSAAIDELQAKADSFVGQQAVNASTKSDELEEQQGGPTVLKAAQNTASAAGIAAAGTSDGAIKHLSLPNGKDEFGITNDVLVGVQHISQTIYSLKDFSEKQNFKSGMVMFMDVASGLNALLQKLDGIGVSAEVFPIVGGAIAGARQLLNLSQVNESAATLDEVVSKIKLSEADKKTIAAFKKEQHISMIKHGTQAIINFASIAAPFLGPAGPVIFGVLKSIVPAISFIRDRWISYIETTSNRAKKKANQRLGVDDTDSESAQELADLGKMIIQENKNNAALDAGILVEESITGSNFSIARMVEVYNELQFARKDLKAIQDGDPAKTAAERNVSGIERALQLAIMEYNSEMARLTGGYFNEKFMPVSMENIQKLHDLHVECIHNIMVEAAARQKKIDEGSTFLAFLSHTEDKQTILKTLYDGQVPEIVDIRLAEMTADADAYFWTKTRKEIGNAIRHVQKSKNTLVDDMNKILKQNKSAILASMQDQDGKGLFQDPARFENDVKIVVNTVSL